MSSICLPTSVRTWVLKKKKLERFYSISLHQQLLNFYMPNIQNEHYTQNEPLCLTLQTPNVDGFNKKNKKKGG